MFLIFCPFFSKSGSSLINAYRSDTFDLCSNRKINGTLVVIFSPEGKLTFDKLSNKELLPALCAPATTIPGTSIFSAFKSALICSIASSFG